MPKKNKVKIRHIWKIDPRTKIIESKTKFNRSKSKKITRKYIDSFCDYIYKFY